MTNQNGTGTVAVKEKLTKAEEKFNETKDMVSEKMVNAADSLHDRSDKTRDALSDRVENAEDYLRQKTYEAGDLTQQKLERANEFAHKAADALESSSEYIKDFDIREAGKTVKKTVKQRPEIGLAIAGTFGLLVGLIIGSRRSN